jgi:nicotinamide riboside kinase
MRQAMKDSNVVVSDGAVITPRVWSLRAFGEELAELAEIDDTGRYDLVALAVPDLPWRDDPLRTNPTNRAIEFELYQRLLADTEVQVVTMSGEGPSRIGPVISALVKDMTNRQKLTKSV